MPALRPETTCEHLLILKHRFHDASPQTSDILMVAAAKPPVPVIFVVQSPLTTRQTPKFLLVVDNFGVLEMENEICQIKTVFRFDQAEQRYMTN